jgi:hypothetical protein
VNFQEFNLMNLRDINALSEREDRLMCMSIHGVNKEEDPPPGVQTELLSHEGHMRTIWIHDAKFASDKSVDAPIPTAAQSSAKETCAKALADWDKHHGPNVDKHQSFDKDTHAAVRHIVEENIDIHIPTRTRRRARSSPLARPRRRMNTSLRHCQIQSHRHSNRTGCHTLR